MNAALASFAGRWAVVTGAADGVGREISRQLLARGLSVAIVDVRGDAARTTAAALSSDKRRVRAVQADVSDRSSITDAAEHLAADGVVPSLLWINAGVGVGAGVLTAAPAVIEWAMSVNVLGPIWTAQAFVPHLRTLDGPKHVAVTCSSASLTSARGPFTLYHHTKHGTASVADALAAELSADGIGVTAFCPGRMNTNIWDAGRARPERFGGPRHQPHDAGAGWRTSPLPEAFVAAAIACIDAGGGYCAPGPEPDTLEEFDKRIRRLRAGFDYLVDDAPPTTDRVGT